MGQCLKTHKAQKLAGPAASAADLHNSKNSSKNSGHQDQRLEYCTLPQGRRFVRTVKIHPGQYSENINLEFTQEFTDLDDLAASPQYEALSYVWGSEDDKIPVTIGPHDELCQQFVTRNLFGALLHLRLPDRPREMWIDALCINQDDMEEKGRQVALMGDVYKRASRVIVWLGPEEHGSERALDILKEIDENCAYSWQFMCLMPKAGAADPTFHDPSSVLPYSAQDLRAIESLFGRSWFERLWIRQEVGLSTKIRVQVGRRSISWKSLGTGIGYLSQKHDAPRIANFVWRLYRKSRGASYGLVSLTYDTRGSKCKDPRDRIYALMSLIHNMDRIGPMVPNYNASVADVYKDMAVRYLEKAHDLELLLGCGHHQDSVGAPEGLPSWVPDWSNDAEADILWLPFTCGRLFESKATYRGSNILQIAGIHASRISRTWPLDILSTENLLASIRSIASALKCTQGTLKSIELESVPHTTSLSETEALCFTLFCGKFRRISFDEAKEQLELALSLGSSYNSHDTKTWKVLANQVRGRHFIETDHGRMGLALRHTKPEDLVCIALGSSSPVVLRPAGKDQYRLCGVCYVDGIMSAEPLLGPLPEDVAPFWDIDAGDRIRFRNGVTGLTTSKDPRLCRLGIDLTAYEEEWQQKGTPLIDVGRETWEKLGIVVQDFSLI